MTDRTTVRLPGELLTQAKRKAAAEGRTLTALIEEGLRRVLAEKRESPAQDRLMPRVSTAKGGFAPGVTSFRDIQEMEDEAYIARLKTL